MCIYNTYKMYIKIVTEISINKLFIIPLISFIEIKIMEFMYNTTNMIFTQLNIPVKNNAASNKIKKKRKIIFKYFINFKIILLIFPVNQNQ